MFIRVITDTDRECALNTDKIISVQKSNDNKITTITTDDIDSIKILSPSYEELVTKLIEEQNEKRGFIEYTIDKTLNKLENTIVNTIKYAVNTELNKVDPVSPQPPSSDNESYPDYLKRRLEDFLKGESI